MNLDVVWIGIAVLAVVGIGLALLVLSYASELRRTRETLREARERMSSALASLGVGAWEVEVRTRVVVWGENAAALLASSPDPIRTVDDIVNRMHPDDRPVAMSAIERAIAARTTFDVESRVILPDGGIRWMRNAGRMIAGEAPGSGRLIGVTTDVTSRHVLEAQFLQAQKMEAIGQLAGGVAHDFNNLLTAILGYSTLVKEGLTDPVPRRNVDEVIKAATRATALTKQLLAFSRQEVLAVVVLNANDIIQDLLDMLRRLIGEHIALTTTLADDLEGIRSDRGQLEQVIVNLILNARDAMPQGGSIRIETTNVRIDSEVFAQGGRIPTGEYVLLAVHDSGVGISDAVRRRLFQPFFTTKDRGKGTGLGLATVFGIVSAGHGYISVESETGKGAVFRVYWPRIVSPERERQTWTTEPESQRATSTRSSVLIVEDEEAVRYLSRVILERAGYRVFEAGTPDQAESVLSKAGPVDVLIADVMLPGGRGPELFERLRPRYPGLRVVFMSGYFDEAIPEVTQVDPAMRFLQKPFVAEALLGHVADLLAAASAAR
ncbi:MAG TPA: ATP-binding protein [Vicinamibacterales bacterium]|nr:ATP-binding protein [Vicinamibacterales bacterium]